MNFSRSSILTMNRKMELSKDAYAKFISLRQRACNLNGLVKRLTVMGKYNAVSHVSLSRFGLFQSWPFDEKLSLHRLVG